MADMLQTVVDQPLTRKLKGGVLLALMVLNLSLIAYFFSYYTLRRDLENALATALPKESFETLIFDASSGRDIIREVNEYRCLQRDMITFYRLGTMNVRKSLSELYSATTPLRDDIRRFVANEASTLNVSESHRKLESVWGLPMYSELVPLAGVDQSRVQQDFEALTRRHTARLKTILEKHDELRQLVSSFDGEWGPAQKALLDIWRDYRERDGRAFQASAVESFEGALGRLRREYDRVGLGTPDKRNLLIRRLAIDANLRDQTRGENILSEFVGTIEGERNSSTVMRHLNCDTFDAELKKKLGEALKVRVKMEGPASEDPVTLALTYLASAAPLAPSGTTALVGGFVGSATATQTLIIAMLFGSLGALSLQALRLSNAGFWGQQPDPRWTDIGLSVVLGMSAALIVFVLASLGDKIVSDTRAPMSQVSTGLVALLGFVSGLLNDDAFARIRTWGRGWFGQDGSGGQSGPVTGFDVDLCDLLRKAGCERFGELALLHLVGSRLAARERFTLFVPSNASFDELPLKRWRALCDRKQASVFDAFLAAQLHELGTLDSGLLTSAVQKGESLVMANGRTVVLARSAEAVTIDGAPIRLDALQAFRAGTIVPLDDAVPDDDDKRQDDPIQRAEPRPS